MKRIRYILKIYNDNDDKIISRSPKTKKKTLQIEIYRCKCVELIDNTQLCALQMNIICHLKIIIEKK